MEIFLGLMLLIGAVWFCGALLGVMFKLFLGLFGAIAGFIGGMLALLIGLPLVLLVVPFLLLLIIPIVLLWALAHLLLPLVVVGGAIWLLVRNSRPPAQVSVG